MVAARLFQRREGMKPGKFRPRNGKHLRRGVQLHRAGTERNHRGGQRQVARFQPFDVTQHLRLAVVAVEDRVFEEVRSPKSTFHSLCGKIANCEAEGLVAIKDLENFRHDSSADGLVERDGDGFIVNHPKIHPMDFRKADNVSRQLFAQGNRKRVKKPRTVDCGP